MESFIVDTCSVLVEHCCSWTVEHCCSLTVLHCCSYLVFFDKIISTNQEKLLRPGVTFLFTLWLTEALASVGCLPHQVTILGRRGQSKGMRNTEGRGNKQRDDKWHPKLHLWWEKLASCLSNINWAKKISDVNILTISDLSWEDWVHSLQWRRLVTGITTTHHTYLTRSQNYTHKICKILQQEQNSNYMWT